MITQSKAEAALAILRAHIDTSCTASEPCSYCKLSMEHNELKKQYVKSLNDLKETTGLGLDLICDHTKLKLKFDLALRLLEETLDHLSMDCPAHFALADSAKALKESV